MLGVRFLKSGTQVTLEQAHGGEEEPVLNLDLKLQLSVANLLEVLLKSCQSSELVAPSGDAEGVTDDRRAPSLGSTEKENTVSSPVVSQAAVPKDSTNEGETKPANEPSAAAKLGLVHSDAADDGSAEAVVGWESFTGKEPTIPTEEASFLNTLPQKPPTLPTWGPLPVPPVPERSSFKKKNKIEEFPLDRDHGPALAVIETHLRELSRSLSFAHETHQASLQRQERHVHSSMISLGDRIHNLASNMKFQTASISRGVAEQSRRLDSVCDGISSLENGFLSELREIRESQLKTQTPNDPQTAQMSTAASSKDNAGSPAPSSHKPEVS